MCKFEEHKVENLWFSSIFYLFLFYCRLLPLGVCIYTFGAENGNFCSKSIRPGSVLIKNLLGIQFSPYFLRFCIDFPKFLMRQPRFVFWLRLRATAFLLFIYRISYFQHLFSYNNACNTLSISSFLRISGQLR